MKHACIFCQVVANKARDQYLEQFCLICEGNFMMVLTDIKIKALKYLDINTRDYKHLDTCIRTRN